MKRVIAIIIVSVLLGFGGVYGNSDTGGGFDDSSGGFIELTSPLTVESEIDSSIVYKQKIKELESENHKLNFEILTQKRIQKRQLEKIQSEGQKNIEEKNKQIGILSSKITEKTQLNAQLSVSSKITFGKILTYFGERLTLLVNELGDMGWLGIILGLVIAFLGMVFMRAVVTIVTFPVGFLFKNRDHNVALWKKRHADLLKKKNVLETELRDVKRAYNSYKKSASRQGSQSNVSTFQISYDEPASTDVFEVNDFKNKTREVGVKQENKELTQNPFQELSNTFKHIVEKKEEVEGSKEKSIDLNKLNIKNTPSTKVKEESFLTQKFQKKTEHIFDIKNRKKEKFSLYSNDNKTLFS